jgi:hypothetical protein
MQKGEEGMFVVCKEVCKNTENKENGEKGKWMENGVRVESSGYT